MALSGWLFLPSTSLAEAPAPFKQVDMVVVVDRSASMGLTVGGSSATRWELADEGITALIDLAVQESDQFALNLFPAPGAEDACEGSLYDPLQYPLDIIEDNGNGLQAALDAVTPAGATPTQPALAGSLDEAVTHKLADVSGDTSLDAIAAAGGTRSGYPVPDLELLDDVLIEIRQSRYPPLFLDGFETPPPEPIP